MASSAAVEEAKRALRARMRAVTRVIGSDPARRAERSSVIADRLVDDAERHLAGRPGRVMVFEPWRTEPDLATFVMWCERRGDSVFVPEVDGDDMWAVPGRVEPASLDLVVVPGLAFAADGRRLGRGGGHYDRFLAATGAHCRWVGVGFAEQLVDDVPVARHDVRLHAVVTDATAPAGSRR